MKNLSIGRRLGLAFFLVLLIATISAATGVWRMQSTANATRDLLTVPLAKERLISDWVSNIHAGVRRTAAIARSSDASLVEFFAEDAKSTAEASNKYQKEVEGLLRSEAEKAVFAELVKSRKAYLWARDEVTRLKKEGETDRAMKVLNESFTPMSKAYMSGMQQLLAEQRKLIDTTALEIDDSTKSGRNLILALGLSMLIVGTGLALVITRGITRPLNEALSATRRVTAGDLSAPLPTQADTRDEAVQMLASLGAMQRELARVIGGVRQSTDSINTASAEIASGSQDLSSRTEQTAGSLQQTASSIEQLTGTVRQTADSARTANQLATSASEVAQRGGSVVTQVVSTMDEINTSSKRIADIIGTIDGIAFQTNILALNAAVEAARAGEQGRGFAVVASEVRSLAQRSAEAAREIKGLIANSVEKVESGSRLVADAGQTMGEIVSSVQRVTDMIAEISAAAAEQSSGIALVNGAVVQLDTATQQNAALVEESTAAAESLQEQARQLTEALSRFKLSSGELAGLGA